MTPSGKELLGQDKLYGHLSGKELLDLYTLYDYLSGKEVLGQG